jgi:hypothetical protein
MIKFFMDQSKKDPQNYMKFYEDYGLFFREGIVTTHDQDQRVRLKCLSSKLFCHMNCLIKSLYVLGGKWECNVLALSCWDFVVLTLLRCDLKLRLCFVGKDCKTAEIWVVKNRPRGVNRSGRLRGQDEGRGTRRLLPVCSEVSQRESSNLCMIVEGYEAMVFNI